jgi:hypothetical protein
MLDHVPIFLGHELLKSTGKLYIIKTHRNTSLYRGKGNPLPIGKTRLYATSQQEFEVECTGLTRSKTFTRNAYGNKDQKRLSMRNVDRPSNHMLTEKYYNFLIFNATSQKAHPARKKP